MARLGIGAGQMRPDMELPHGAEPPAQRLRVNAERSEPKGSVYAEWRRW